MSMSMKIAGIPEMQGKLKLMQQATNEDATRRAVRAGSAAIREAMTAEAPVLDEWTAKSTALEPGTLKEGIRFSVRKLKGGVFRGIIGPRRGTRRAAHLVEYGHLLIKGGKLRIGPKGPVGDGKVIGHVPAHPFLRPAYESSWKLAIAAFAEVLKSSLKSGVS
jgi:HK97 gp10 family phage protein